MFSKISQEVIEDSSFGYGNFGFFSSITHHVTSSFFLFLFSVSTGTIIVVQMKFVIPTRKKRTRVKILMSGLVFKLLLVNPCYMLVRWLGCPNYLVRSLFMVGQ